MTQENPEIGQYILAGGFETNYHDLGQGDPVLMLHGSGPGVSAWANWRLALPILSQSRRVIAPDLLGFGFTQRPDHTDYDLLLWRNHLIAFLDTLELERVDLIGNSFGGALALSMAVHHPTRIRRLVLMGAAGVEFELTPGLDRVWGYNPSPEEMFALLDIFTFNKSFISQDLADMRYRASVQAGFHESYSQMFPAPRQNAISKIATPEKDIAGIQHKTLIIHGYEDQVIPVENSFRFLSLIEHAQLHVFRQCGHWTQIEQSDAFNALVGQFLSQAD